MKETSERRDLLQGYLKREKSVRKLAREMCTKHFAINERNFMVSIERCVWIKKIHIKKLFIWPCFRVIIPVLWFNNARHSIYTRSFLQLSFLAIVFAISGQFRFISNVHGLLPHSSQQNYQRTCIMMITRYFTRSPLTSDLTSSDPRDKSVANCPKAFEMSVLPWSP